MRLGAVLMASGAGQRFGSNKLLHPVDGVPMIKRAMTNLPAELFHRACVVSCYPEILALAGERGYVPVPNPDAAQGQSASVRLGLAALADMDGVLFCVCDQPWLRRDSVERLLADFSAHPGCICALGWRGERGSPAVFPRELFPELLALAGDRGGGAVIRAHQDRLRLVEAHSSDELQDMDTPFDLMQAEKKDVLGSRDALHGQEISVQTAHHDCGLWP